MENILKCKSISFNGDSICAGAGSPGGYGRIIAERNEMKYKNVAVGGGTVCAETYSKSGEKRHWICRTIDKMDENADYAIVEGGVNDASLFSDYGAPAIGALSDGFNASLDDTTFYGAFESMLKQLTIKYSANGRKIGYIAVHKMTARFSHDYVGDDNYYLAAKRCCEKWGVPFLDLNVSIPPFAFFTPDGDPELYAVRAANTYNGDGWHPNEAGYKNYYCDKIEAWLKTL